MEFKILGPLEVRQGERRLECRGQKQRLLLGILLLNANEVVSSDRLTEALWGERPPQGSGKALQVHMSRLRDMLEPGRARGGSGGILVTRPPGYELRVEPGQLDLHRFEQAVGESKLAAEAGRPEEAAQALHEALSLWRGPALADLTFEGALQPDIARLEELRLAALEDRFEADLELGRHAGLIGELEAHIGEQPLRERPRGQLMLALYRSGRQAEALDAYREARRVLVEELGLEPGRRLKELERDILAQDRGARSPAGGAGRGAGAGSARSGRARGTPGGARRAAPAVRGLDGGKGRSDPRRGRAGDRQEPARRGARRAGFLPRSRRARRALLGGGRSARLLALGPGAALVRARLRSRAAALAGRTGRCPARDDPPGAARTTPRTLAGGGSGFRARSLPALRRGGVIPRTGGRGDAAGALHGRPPRRRRAFAAAAALHGAGAGRRADPDRRLLPRHRGRAGTPARGGAAGADPGRGGHANLARGPRARRDGPAARADPGEAGARRADRPGPR